MKIAVIVPVYNAARFLPRCVASLERQDFRALAAIFVDDGSTDGSRSVLEGLKGGPVELQVLSQPNAGVSAARNAGLERALSDMSVTHIMFLDADDRYADGCVARVAAAAERDPEAVVEFGFTAVDESGRELRRYPPEGNNVWCRCYPKSVIGGVRFFTGANVAEDIAFNLELSHRRHPRIVRIGEPLYDYTDNPASAMNRRFTAEDFRRRSALVEYLVGVHSDCVRALGEFARTELPDLLRQFYRQLRRTADGESAAAAAEFRRLLRSLRGRGLLRMRRGRLKDFKYHLRFLWMSR